LLSQSNGEAPALLDVMIEARLGKEMGRCCDDAGRRSKFAAEWMFTKIKSQARS
jgi:hypothetical protein